MIDTHVHLNIGPLTSDWRGVCDRAEASGVSTFVVIGFDMASSECAVAIAGQDHRCYAVVGVHPGNAEGWDSGCAGRLREWSKNPRVVGIGEIGLDFYTGQNNERTPAPVTVQERCFQEQLALAGEVGLPVVIHCRDAYEETMALLEREAGETPVLLHCFAGTMAQAQRAFARHWYIGVGGTVTYKKSQALREIVRDAPAVGLVLETDAPYLSPEPLRGRFPNVPERIPLIADAVAQVRGETRSVVSAMTDANACRIFDRIVSPVVSEGG